MVTVVYLTDSVEADLAGRTVQEIRTTYEHQFNIPTVAIPKVNGTQVSEDYILKDGDKLAFEKTATKHVP